LQFTTVKLAKPFELNNSVNLALEKNAAKLGLHPKLSKYTCVFIFV